MSQNRPEFDYRDESQMDKLSRKAKDSPFMIIGLVGLVAACGLGYRNYRYKGGMSTSVYLMQLRVIAQGTVVSALTIGLAYSMAREHLFKDKKN